MRQAHVICEIITAAAGAFTTGSIDVSGFDTVQIDYKAAGAAAAAVADVQLLADDGGTVVHTDAVTVGIGGQGSIVYGAESQQPAGASVVNGGPVPRFINIRGTGGAASTVTIRAIGIRRETQIRG